MNFYEKRIKELDDRGCTWEKQEVRERLIEMAQEFFDEKIRWKEWKAMTKDYFKNVSKFSRYQMK